MNIPLDFVPVKLAHLFEELMLSSNSAIVAAGEKAVQTVRDKSGKLEKNQYKELIIGADKAVREAVSKVIKNSGLPIGLLSEDVDGLELFNCNTPEYIVSLDEQDGLGVAIEKGSLEGARYGTMAAIFQGTNPLWRDTLIGGVMEHGPKRRIVYGSNLEERAYILDTHGYRITRTSGKRTLDDRVKILADRWFNVVNMLGDIPFVEFGVTDVGASERGYVDVATGDADALVECTRKDNQEPAISYVLIKNAGGSMYSLRLGNYFGATDFASAELVDVGDWNYLESAKMAKTGRAPIFTTSTPELAEAMIDHINKLNDWKGSVMRGNVTIGPKTA